MFNTPHKFTFYLLTLHSNVPKFRQTVKCFLTKIQINPSAKLGDNISTMAVDN